MSAAAVTLFNPTFGGPRITSVVLGFRARSWVRWSMLLADALAVECALLLGIVVRLALAAHLPGIIGPRQFLGVALGVLLLPFVNLGLEMYPGYGLSPVERMRRRVYSTAAVFGALTVWDHLVLGGLWSRGILLATFAFALAFPPLFEMLLRWVLIRRGCWGVPVLVLGAANTGTALVEIFHRRRELGLVPVAVLDDNPGVWNTRIDGVPVIGPLRKARSLRDAADVVVIAIPGLPRTDLLQWMGQLDFAHVIVIPDLLGLQTQWVRALDLGGHLGLEIRRNLIVPTNRFLKRALDYVLCLPMFLVSLPVIGLLAFWVKRASPGPAFYSQERDGSNGQRIRVWKLRTMHQNADALLHKHLETNPADREHWHRFFKLKQDPRIIPGIGRLLRRTSLDELPQLYNVLRGDMSLVGPRPFPRYHLVGFSSEFRNLRGSVRPGLTGLWQVSERSNGDLKEQETLDTYYIRNWSVWLDVYLIFRTVRAVMAGSGAY